MQPYNRMSSNDFEPSHIRFTNHASYERSPIPSSPENTCIFISTVPSEHRFAFHKSPKSLHLLLEERNARFTHLIIFLQCHSVVPCITRENRIRKPRHHATPLAGEADHPSTILSFSSLVSWAHVLTLSLPSVLPYILHDTFLFNFCRCLVFADPSDHTTRFKYVPRLPQIHPLHVQ